MVPRGVKALGIRIGVNLIEQSLYKHATPIGTDNELDRQTAEDTEYAQRVQDLLRKALQPRVAKPVAVQEAKVLSVPQ